MKAVCVESRPHPDFVGDKWWTDLGIIIRECQKRDMKIWILDDSHFPTGFANGKVKEKYPEYLKQYLTMRRFDIVGPFKGARIDASLLKGRPWEQHQAEIIDVLGVYLVDRASQYNETGDPIKSSTTIDITDQFVEDTIYLDVPKGNWSVFVVFSTHEGGEETTEDYLNPLVSQATQVLIDEVYEKHKNHVGQYFGNTITAFFSDEPRFGNEKGTESRIGKADMVLPWRPGLEKELNFSNQLLPLLWVPDTQEAEREVRYAYMDLITKEYNKNFTKVLADWCQAHGLDYLGHNIEDNGAHARLGYGVGHFFRGQEAQHFSGIDVIGGQVVPGMPYHHDAYQTGGSDGQFYHFALAKLGASAAHLYPHKQGRAMCEAYGAYGWNEGLKTMKWISDHLIVRGINHIVPHAFSPKEYPDWDCPPHFYARGNNPQFRYMPKLNHYLNRLMTIFNDGKHKAPVALFYPAEFEWAGKYMPIEVLARVLTENQIDFDIVSHDLLKSARMADGKLIINGQKFEVLIVPYAEYIPKDILTVFNKLIEEGINVIFTDNLPENQHDLSKTASVINLKELPTNLASIAEISLGNPFSELVYYHYQKENKDYWMFFNESLDKIVDTKIHFSQKKGRPVAYDAYEDSYHPVYDNHLLLKPYQTIVWIFGGDFETQAKASVISTETLTSMWTVSLSKATDYPNFTEIGKVAKLAPINSFKEFDRMSGTAAYTTKIRVENADTIIGLDLGKAYEIAEVFINGISVGQQIAPPYQFAIEGILKEGDNELRIEVTNTLGTQFRGGLNQYLTIEPFGLTEEIKILRK